MGPNSQIWETNCFGQLTWEKKPVETRLGFRIVLRKKCQESNSYSLKMISEKRGGKAISRDSLGEERK